MKSQRGLSIMFAIVVMALLGIIAIFGAKLAPAYIEFNSVRKIILAMKADGDTNKSVREIRGSFEKRAAIDYIESVKADDLDITKEAGEVVVTAQYQKKIPIVANMSACLDFYASTKEKI